MAKWMRITLTAAGTFVGISLLVLIGAFSYLQTPQAQHLIQKQVNRLLPGKITWRRLDVSLTEARVDIRNLLLEGPDRERLAGWDRFQAEFSWKALFKGRMAVEEVRIDHPWANLTVDESGRLNLMRAFPEPSPAKEPPAAASGGLPIAVTVDDLRLSDGAVSYHDAKAALKVSLEGISMTADAVVPDTPAGRLTFAVGRGTIESPVFTGPVEELRGAADLDADRLSPASLRVKVGRTDIALAGTVARLGSDPTLDVTLDADLAIAEIRQFFKLGSRMTGDARLHVSATGPLSNPDAAVTLDYGGGVLGDVSVDRISLALALADQNLAIDSLSVASSLGNIDADGNVDLRRAFPNGFLLPERRLDQAGGRLAVNIDGLLLDKALALAKIEGVRGMASAEAVLDGTVAQPSVSIVLSGRKIVLPQAVVGDLRIEANLDDAGTVDIQSLVLNNRGSQVTVRGKIDLLEYHPDRMFTVRPDLPVDLAVGLDDVAPADFLEKQDVHGRIDGTVTAEGPVRSPEVRADITGNGLAVGPAVIGDVNARIRMSDGRMLLAPVTVQNGRSKVSLTGGVGVMSPATGAVLDDPTLDLRLSGEAIYLEDFIDGMEGRLSFKGDVGGSVARPRGTVDVNGKQLNLSGQNVDGVALAVRMDGRKFTVDRFQVAVAPQETIDGKGVVDLARSAYEGSLSSGGISLAHIDAVGGPNLVSGKLALDISGQGTFDDPQAKGTISTTNLQVNQKRVEDVMIHLMLKDHIAQIRGRPGFDLEARYHLDQKNFSASLAFDRTELAPYFKIAGMEDIEGRIDGTIQADGRIDASDTLKVEADLKNLILLSDGKELLAAPRIQARLNHNDYVVSDTEIRLLKDGRVHLRGRGNLDGKLAMTIGGRIPMAVAQPFLDEETDVRGAIDLDAVLTGTAQKPDLRGNIILDRIGMNFQDLSQRLHDVNGRIGVTPDVLVLHDVEGRMGDGRFTASGRVDLKEFKPVRMDVQLTARQLPIEIPDTLSLLLNSRLNLAGTAEKSVLKGEIVLLEGEYIKDVKLNLWKEVTEKTRKTEPEAPSAKVPFLSGMKLNIIVKRRESFIVENNVASMSLSPDLRILGTAAQPVISGRAAVDEGVIHYQKTEFDIEKGVVDFLNPYKTEPTIDIEGEATVRDWIISLKVSGPPDNLKFALSSDPALEDGDILSLLLVGKTLAELGQSGGGSGLSARQIIGDVLAESVSSKVKDATGLDIVEMEVTDAEDGNDTEDVKVTLGKDLSRRLTVKYGAELKNGQTVQKMISEYKILEDLLVSAFQDTEGNFGGALIYRMEFR